MLPASEDGGCGSFFDYSETGVFHGGFASSSNQPFASASYDGVLRVCFSLSLDTIHFGVLGVLFSHHHGSGDFPITTIKSLHGSRKKKNIDI